MSSSTEPGMRHHLKCIIELINPRQCGGTTRKAMVMSEISCQSEMTVLRPSDLDTLPMPEAHPALAVRSSGLSDRGRIRESNEDQYLIASLVKALQVQSTSLPIPKVQQGSARSHLFIVADGMGGHAGGERASAVAIDSVETFVLETFKWFAQL